MIPRGIDNLLDLIFHSVVDRFEVSTTFFAFSSSSLVVTVGVSPVAWEAIPSIILDGYHGSTVTQFQILLNQPMWIIGSDIATDQHEWDRYDHYYHHPLVPQTIHSCSFLFTLSNQD